jgi:hypothetical protein
MILANFSMEAGALLRVPDWVAMWSWSPLVRVSDYKSALSFTPAFPGIVALALAVYAVIHGLRDKRYRRPTLLLLTFAIVCYLLALGPILKLVNLDPTPGASWLPMPGKIWLLIPGVRWPMRVFFFALLAFAVLCGLGFQFFRLRFGPKYQRMIMFGVFAIIAIESWPRLWLAQKSADAPAPMALSDAYPFLATEQDRGGVIELPVADRHGWRTPFLTRYTYASAGHLRRVVAIHGSVTPPLTDTLLNAAIQAPDSTAMHFLASHGVTRLVIHVPVMTGTKGTWLAGRLKSAGYPLVFAGREALIFSTSRDSAGTVYAP